MFGIFDFSREISLRKDLEEYINDELKDSRYYELLSSKAPTRLAKETLMEFSRDEKTHADNFMKAYFKLTGVQYKPMPAEEPKVPENYTAALKSRIFAETTDYKKYGAQYLKPYGMELRDLFFMTRTDEAIHAMRINAII